MRRIAIPALAVAAVLTACASGTSSSSPRANSNIITRAEIAEAGSNDAYRLVQSLRRSWLQTRGPTSFRQSADESFDSQQPDVVVYLDGTRLGGPEELRTLSSENIEQIEFLNAARANARFGTGHVNGAILVKTRAVPNSN